MMREMVHAHHAAVAAEIRGWFTTSAPEIGYQVEEHWFGHLADVGAGAARLVLGVDDPARIAAAVTAAQAARPAVPLVIWVDDRARADRLDAALVGRGCVCGDATTHLALVGPLTAATGPATLEVEAVPAESLEEWASVKLRGFADSEEPPAPARVVEEVAVRRSELSIADCRLARLDGEGVAVIAYYHGGDQLVFNLATRIPWRHRGIAQALLARWVAGGRSDGCRSLVINATDGGAPAQLYRRMGFVDEVYWYRRYELAAAR
jgi:hypothetical protein